MTKLTEEQLKAELVSLAGWMVVNGKLHREFLFPDFTYAFGFMATAATAIERNNHHPEWSNVYNRVVVDLTTHDAGGITRKDVELAALLNSIAIRLQ